jgi:uncharacterized protein YhaN
MKILRLDLLRFGPFSGHSLDLSEGQEGLHIVYGANEAGKSSSLRALHQLFYGIPARSSDNFLHSHPQLRIGALLRGRDGSELECIRRKGLKNTLRAADDETVIDESRLAALLGGLDEEAFRRRYGINYEQLVAGGKEIVAGHGDLGQSLFAAGAGVANLRDVQQRLEVEAGELFKANAKLPKINNLLSQWKSRRDDARQLRLSTSDWKKHDEALEQAVARQKSNRAEAHRLQAERDRLGRIRDAIPLLATLRRLEAELGELSGVPLLSEDFSERRAETQSRLTDVRVEIETSHEALIAIEREIGGLGIPSPIVDHAQEIVHLFKKSEAVRQIDEEDIPRVDTELALIESELREKLRELVCPKPELADVEQLRLCKSDIVEIQELASKRAGLEATVEQLKRQVARLEDRVTETNEQLKDSLETIDPQLLREALRNAERNVELEPRLCELTSSITALNGDAKSQLAALGFWKGTLDDVVQLAVPEMETCDRWIEELQTAELHVSQSREQLQEERRKVVELERRVEVIRLEQDVPTEDDLSAAREQRDRGWTLVRRAWLDEEMDEEQVRTNAGEFASARDLADAFDRKLRGADDTVDRLRREAERVAEKSRLLSERRFCDQRIELLAKELESAQERLTEQLEAWNALWHPLQIDPRSPREMRGWLRRHESLLALHRQLRELDREHDALEQRLTDTRRSLVRQLDSAEHETSMPLIDLAAVARKRLAELDDASNCRAKLMDHLRESERELADTRKRHIDAQATLDDWLARWSTAVAKLGLTTKDSPAQANAEIELRRELLEKRSKADALCHRIASMHTYSESFAQRARDLAIEIAPELADETPTSIAEQLQHRLDDAQKAIIRRDEQKQQCNRESERLGKARTSEASLIEKLARLRREAGCTSEDDLLIVEVQSRRKRDLDAEYRITLKQIETLAAGTPFGEFRTAVDGREIEEVTTTLAAIADDLARLEQQHDELQQTIGSQRTLLAQMDGSAKAAEAENEAQCLLAEVRARAEDYARLRLATAVLTGAIERYREKHQGQILKRASDMFAELTLGSFAGLRAEFGEGNKPELVGVRPAGQTVSVLGMSEGTCDQLFLALRLASLEHDVSRREPVPLVVDDIMIMFDDDRSAAALKALARLSERTQVILFTHHDHLVQLAHSVLTEDVLFVHALDYRASTAQTAAEAAVSASKSSAIA